MPDLSDDEARKLRGWVAPPEAAAPNPPTISESSPEPSDARLIERAAEWKEGIRCGSTSTGILVAALAERLRVRGEELVNLREVNGINYRGAEQFAAERNKAEAALSSRDATIAELRQEIERCHSVGRGLVPPKDAP